MSTTFDWPETLRPATVEWTLVVPQLTGRSAFDGSVETDTMGAARWEFTITTGVMTRTEFPEWEAFVDGLRGGVNRARCWDWRREQPLGVATGAPVVRLAAAGASLEVQGWTPSTAGILRAGSYLGVNGELKRLTQTISSDAAGRAVVRFEPPLRAVAPVGTPLLLAKPTAKFVQVGAAPRWQQDGARFPSQTISFQEDLRP